MARSDLWQQQAEGFGRFLRGQRQLAALSLRELGAMTDLSNAYLSQLERGLHQPSLRVLQSLAGALHLSVDEMLARSDEGDRRPAAAADDGPTDRADDDHTTEDSISRDPKLSSAQREALIAMYRALVGPDA